MFQHIAKIVVIGLIIPVNLLFLYLGYLTIRIVIANFLSERAYRKASFLKRINRSPDDPTPYIEIECQTCVTKRKFYLANGEKNFYVCDYCFASTRK